MSLISPDRGCDHSTFLPARALEVAQAMLDPSVKCDSRPRSDKRRGGNPKIQEGGVMLYPPNSGACYSCYQWENGAEANQPHVRRLELPHCHRCHTATGRYTATYCQHTASTCTLLCHTSPDFTQANFCSRSRAYSGDAGGHVQHDFAMSQHLEMQAARTWVHM